MDLPPDISGKLSDPHSRNLSFIYGLEDFNENMELNTDSSSDFEMYLIKIKPHLICEQTKQQEG